MTARNAAEAARRAQYLQARLLLSRERLDGLPTPSPERDAVEEALDALDKAEAVCGYVEVRPGDAATRGRHWGTGGGADGRFLFAWGRADAVEASRKLRAAGVEHVVLGDYRQDYAAERHLCFFTNRDYLRGTEVLNGYVDPEERALYEEGRDTR